MLKGCDLLKAELDQRPEGNIGLGYVEFALAHPQRFRLMRAAGEETYSRLQKAFDSLGSDAPLAAAAAWSLVHGLAHLLLDGHFAQAQRESGGAAAFAKKVLGSMRAARAQRSA